MRDPEFVQLRNRFFLGLAISLCLAIPIFFFLYKSYISSSVITKLNKKEEMVLLITSNKCDKCNQVRDILDDKKIKFYKMNVDTTKDSADVLKRLGITNERNIYPIVVYIKDGEMVANLVVSNKISEVNEFLKFHKIK